MFELIKALVQKNLVFIIYIKKYALIFEFNVTCSSIIRFVAMRLLEYYLLLTKISM